MPASASKDTALEILIFAVVDGRSGSVNQAEEKESSRADRILYEETALESCEPSNVICGVNMQVLCHSQSTHLYRVQASQCLSIL